jgi:DNA end-binding protein Ku
MVLNTLYYADEVRALDRLEELPVEAKIHPNERKMAVQLVDNLAMPFQIEQYRDEYRDAVMAMIEAKSKGEVVVASKAETPGKVIDLMEALRRSVEMARGRQKAPAPKAPVASPSEERGAGRSGGQQRRAAAGGMHERPR